MKPYIFNCLTGFDEYEESLTDGLQVLRYNKTTAYIPHLDWIDDYGKKQEHNCKSCLFALHIRVHSHIHSS